MDDRDLRLNAEIESFKKIWKGGYYEGNPLDPMSGSTYYFQNYMSVLHVVYLTCIKPYVSENSSIIEIGCGRGAWTKTFLQAKEIYCLDALSAKHNKFWEYIGQRSNVKYFQVSDFKLNMLPDDKFDYLFSFGTFCHISLDGITEYMKNMYSKLKKNANCFIMIADYGKFNSVMENERLNIIKVLSNTFALRSIRPIWAMLWFLIKWRYSKTLGVRRNINENDIPSPGRWYNAGTERTCKMLNNIGYRVVDSDVGAVHRDPIIHFIKE